MVAMEPGLELNLQGEAQDKAKDKVGIEIEIEEGEVVGMLLRQLRRLERFLLRRVEISHAEGEGGVVGAEGGVPHGVEGR